MGKTKDRINETRVNNNGEEMRVIRYGGAKDIDIQFVKDGTIIEHREYGDFKKGNIKNPYFPSVCGVGFIGIGEFKAYENRKPTKCYIAWVGMYKRCYDPKYHEKKPTYENCTVCEEWNNYQNYAIWHIENYYEIENEIMMLDKDILKKGNKVYSPETCVFVPVSINSLFVKCNKARGDLPIGVSKHGNKFKATLRKDNETIHLGYFNTPEEAFLAYKIAKEAYIKEVAEKYKGKIDPRAYEAMMKYEVEITD